MIDLAMHESDRDFSKSIDTSCPDAYFSGRKDNDFYHSIVLLIARKDEVALGRLYDASIAKVYSIAMAICRRPEAAEEVVSDVFLQVWNEAVRYDPARGSVLAWLATITRTRALDHLRRRDKAISHPSPEDLIEESSCIGDAADQLYMAEAGTILFRAMQQLSPLHRQLLSLAFYKGFSHTEIAVHCSLPLGSVKTHIRNALRRMRNVLGQDWIPNYEEC